jgi:hypothetical protein
MTVSEVHKGISEARIPVKYKTQIFEAYCLGWKTVTLFASRNWYATHGENSLRSLYRYTGFKSNTNAVFAELCTGMELVGYKIKIYFE